MERSVASRLAMLDEERIEYLKSIYYNPKNPGGFSSVQKLYNAARDEGKYLISKKDVKQFLASSEVYTTHVDKKKAKHFYSIVVPYKNYMLDVDSGFLDLGEKSKNTKLVVAVDAFSRRGSARAVKDLKASTVKRALESILDEFGPGVERLRMDRGTEYRNRTVQSALRNRNIHYFFSYAPNKSNLAERFLKTLKKRLYKIAQHKANPDWSKYLSSALQAYNDSPHSSLGGLTPNQVTDQNTPKLWFKFKRRRLRHMPPHRPYKYDINDPVRVNYARVPFQKNYLEQNSTAVYYVTSRYSRSHINRYKLKDQNGDPVPGSFTENQLTLTHVDRQTQYRIERVIKYRMINGIRHALIKWLNYPSKFNSYIVASDIVDLRESDSESE